MISEKLHKRPTNDGIDVQYVDISRVIHATKFTCNRKNTKKNTTYVI